MADNRLAKFRNVPTNSYDDYAFYTYDHRQRLTLVELYDGDDSETDTLVRSVSYTYDLQNRRQYRIERDSTGGYFEQRYAYDGWDVVLTQQSTVENAWAYITLAYLWLPDGQNSLLLAREGYSGYDGWLGSSVLAQPPARVVLIVE